MSTKLNFSHEWSLVCQRSIVDQETNMLSIIDTIEQVTISLNPDSIQQGSALQEIAVSVHLVSRFRKCTDSENEVGLEVVYEAHNPAGKKIGESVSVPFVMKKGTKNFRIRVTLGKVPVDMSGLYTVHIKAREVGKVTYKRVASVPLEVVINR